MRTRPVLSTRAGKSDAHDLCDGTTEEGGETTSTGDARVTRGIPHVACHVPRRVVSSSALKGHSQRSGEASEGGGPVEHQLLAGSDPARRPGAEPVNPLIVRVANDEALQIRS